MTAFNSMGRLYFYKGGQATKCLSINKRGMVCRQTVRYSCGMSIFEMLACLLAVVAGVSGSLGLNRGRERRWSGLALFASLAGLSVLLLYFSLSGAAVWRLVPLFATLTLLSIAVLLDHLAGRRPGRKATKRFGTGLVSALVLSACLFSGILIWMFPASDLAAPTGSYPVGTSAFELVDASRKRIYLDPPHQERRLMVQVWYPAVRAEKNTKPLPWIPDKPLRSAFATYAGLPPFTMSQLGGVRSSSYPESVLAEARKYWPVLIVSHGWTGSRYVHTDMAEELASRGIVVLALDHTYGSLSVSFPDGTVLGLDSSALPPAENQTLFASQARRLVATYTADIQALIAAVRLGYLPDFLSGRVDANRIALLGHSTGGAAAIQAGQTDRRLVAIGGFDAWLEPLGAAVDQPAGVPQLHFGSEQWQNGSNRVWVNRQMAANSALAETGSFGYFYIAGSAHMDFAMLGLFTRAARFIGWGGKLPRADFVKLANRPMSDWLATLLQAESAESGRMSARLIVEQLGLTPGLIEWKP